MFSSLLHLVDINQIYELYNVTGAGVDEDVARVKSNRHKMDIWHMVAKRLLFI